MRVISGKLGGRQFKSPKGHRTHPMSEKVRGGLFNLLGDIDGLKILDAFGGSGALSLEAISRGAEFATIIDIDKKAVSVIKVNAAILGVSKHLKVIHANCSAWSENNTSQTFDLVIAAPPYDDLQVTLLQKLTRHVKHDGLYILDWPGSMDVPELQDLDLIKIKNYGDAQLVFYRKIS